MTEFCHKRIKRRLEVIKERKNNDDNRWTHWNFTGVQWNWRK
jgi:hypothetical protein